MSMRVAHARLHRPRIARRLLALILLAAAALVSGLLVAVGSAARRAPSGLIAFARWDGIYVMRPDGSGVRALRRGGVASQPRELAWSRDGSRLLFVTRHDGIWSMAADGGDLVRVGAGRSPSWAPDGRRVAFTKYGNRGYIWVVDADGGNAHRLVKAPAGFVWEVDWNPLAGNRLAFSTGGYVSELYVMNTNGSNARQLDFGVEPAWSPNGRRIAFSSNWTMRTAEIYLLNVAGGSPKRLTENTVFDGAPTWSPDGSTIAFVRSSRVGPICANCPPAKRGTSEIYVIGTDGTGLTRLTHNGIEEGSPAWQPVAGS